MKARPATKAKSVPSAQPITEEAGKLADFVIFTQRSCILNLSPQLVDERVSFPQFFFLVYLANEDFMTMTSVAKKMGHSTAAATGMVDKLEELGYITRTQAAKDRRKIMVQITDAGRKFVSKMRQNIARDLAGILQRQDEDASSLVPSRDIILKQQRHPF